MHLQPAQLLERVDHRVLVRAEGQRAPGVGQPAERADAVGEVPFGGRAGADRGPGGAEQVDVGVAEVGRVHRGRPRAEHAVLVQQRGRRAAVVGQGRGVLGRLLAEVDVQRTVAQRRPDRRQRGAGHRPHRVDGGTDPRLGGRLQQRHPLGPPFDRAVGEAPLHRVQLAVTMIIEAAGQVAGVEQGEPDPGLGRRRRSTPRPSHSGRRRRGRRDHGAGSGTRRRGVAGHDHLGVDRRARAK